MPSFRGIDYADHTPDVGGMTVQLAPNASRIERQIQVPWRETAKACTAFLGWPYIQSLVTGVDTISRVTPHAIKLPMAENLAELTEYAVVVPEPDPWLYATSVSRIEGVGPRVGYDDQGLPKYDTARITFAYTSLSYDIYEDTDGVTFGTGDYAGAPDEATLTRYITRLYRPGVRAVTIPRQLTKWTLEENDLTPAGAAAAAGYVTAGPAVLESLAKTESTLDLIYVHHQRPDLPLTAIMDAMGCVNSVAFDGFPAGTLLMAEGPDIRPERSCIGQRTYDVHFKFKFVSKVRATPSVLRVGWNWFLRCFKIHPSTDTLDYRKITSSGLSAGSPVYQEYDFYSLFRPET